MSRPSKAKRFFSEEEKKRIIETTREIEAKTIGEVAVMVVDRSSSYREAEVLAGLFWGALLALVITTFFFDSSLRAFIPLGFSFFLAAWFLSGRIPALKKPFISTKRKEGSLRRRALEAFYEKGLYRTKKNTGVLLFLSLFEHKVWVLADKGIYEKIDQDILNGFARTVSQGIRDGRACEALCETMRDAGALLEKHFPMTEGDTNELPDGVITECRDRQDDT